MDNERYSDGAVSSFDRYVAGFGTVFDRKTGDTMPLPDGFDISRETARQLNNGADRDAWTWTTR